MKRPLGSFMDVESLQRFQAQSELQGYLSTRIGHEDSTRHLQWSEIVLYSGLLVVVFGAAATVLAGGVSRSDWLSQSAVVTAILASGFAFVTFNMLLSLIRAQYKCLLHQTKTVIDWSQSQQHSATTERERLASDERAMLLLSLANVADSIDDDNRRRASRILNAKRLTVVAVYLVLAAGVMRIASIWSFEDVTRRQSQITQEDQAQRSDTEKTEQTHPAPDAN